MERPYELDWTPDGMVARVRLRGHGVLAAPLLNRGTAFTPDEREELGLTGLLPDAVSTMEGQLARAYGQYLRQPDDLSRNLYLANLRDRNEVLFYRLLTEHIEEMLPIVYTPTIGTAIERYSYEFGRPRGVYLSVDHPDQVETAFRNYGLGPADVDLVVATDAEGILGIGDWGAGGIAIAVGKLAVYVAAAGLHPGRVIPVVLDTGTDNPELLAHDNYVGARHPRVRGEQYDQLIAAYVATATRMFPYAMLHWEDFGAANANRILTRYAGSCCTFNDDMQGTAAVVLAAALGAVRTAGTRLRDQRVVIHGAGTAGIGIADVLRQVMIAEGLPAGEAASRFWALGSKGLLTSDYAATMRDFQVPYARQAHEVAGWSRDGDGRIELAEVVTRTHPTMLIGTSTQPGVFTEDIVTEMAAHAERPIIMPLSNPTSRVRGPARRPDRLDRRASADRHRQPVRPGDLRRRTSPDRPGQQRADIPRPRLGRHRRPGQPGQRRHAGRRGCRPGRPHRRQHARCRRAALSRQPARCIGRGRGRRRPGRAGRGAGPDTARRPRQAGRPGDVDTRLPHDRGPVKRHRTVRHISRS